MAKIEGDHHVNVPPNYSLQIHQPMMENNMVEINNIKGDLDLVKSPVDNETESWYPSTDDSQIWFPPEPDDQTDNIEGSFGNYDEDDDDSEEFGDDIKWEKPSDLTEKYRDEKRKAMDDVMSGKFKTLVKSILKSMNISCKKDKSGDNWVDIVTNLSWEAASLLKKENMDPDGYVKVKCIATGSRSQSEVFNGLVFKKHAAHKHMPTTLKKPKLLLIKGALSGSDGFSSFESMNQEKNRLDSVIGKIEKCNPNVVLVEKTVSRDIQEYILSKGMTLVLEMKMNRLERIARCTGSPIFSYDQLKDGKLKRCDSFYFEKVVEEHDDVCESGKKPPKTLMFLEGLPKRMGCTILLKGSNSDELKNIKIVVQFAVNMAYHLILESSFLLNQKVMFSTIAPDIFATKIPSEEISPSTSNDSFDVEFHDANIPVSNESDDKIESNESKDKIQITPISNETYTSVLFTGLSSLTSSLKKVVGIRLLNTARSISTYFGFTCISPQSTQGSSSTIPVEGEKVISDEEKKVNDDQVSEDSLETNSSEEEMESKDDMNTVLESESILILMSKRNGTRGIICEQHRFSCIKFYRYFDTPLGKFLRDNLLNQEFMCTTCGEQPEAHAYYYAHHDMQLTIQVRCLPADRFDKHLNGEKEGKIWMWSCCGKCKPSNGSLKFTKRVLVSTSARSLSFGKFLELGFSNHSSCDIKSSCGHQFYKDYFHFFGLGSMVAMFRYSEVSTYSVALPQWKVEFSDKIGGEFLKKEVEDVYGEGLSVFAEVENSLKKMEIEFVGSMLKLQGSLKKFSDVEDMLNQERDRFEVEMKNTADDGASRNHWMYKPLSLNHLQWELLLESCIWDHRLHSLLSPDLKVIDTKTIDDTLPLKEEDSKINLNGEFSSTSAKLANPKGWMWDPFQQIETAYMNDLQSGYLPEFQPINNYTTGSKIYKTITEEGSKLHFPVGPGNNYMVSDYEDELSSIIACALAYLKDRNISPEGLDDPKSEESHFFSFDGLELLDSVDSVNILHPIVSMGRFTNKVKYTVGCLFANEFMDLRNQCGLSELDFIAALSRGKHWNAKGGKSKSYFAKTLDGRFIIKEIKKTEFYSFLEFAKDYFRYMNECFNFGNQTCLAKILGIYQVKKRKSGVKLDLMVMENITYCRNMIRQYDLKGALYSRFNSSVGVAGDVYLDQNFVDDMNVAPLYVNRKAKRNLQRAVWNDTVFLNSIHVMDYSLLVGVDAERKELVCGIIDYVRQYTWDKQVENWVKSYMVPKNQMPTVISPKEYKKRFRKFMDTHFLSVPDDWCSQRPSNRCTLCGVATNANSHGCEHSTES